MLTPELTILISRLKEANISLQRFLKVNEKKAAFETEWQNKLYSPEKLEGYSRWGITGRDGLVLIDADNPTMSEILQSILPPTFEVISPRRKLPHFYIQVINGETPNKTLHLPGEKKGVGEIRAQNEYLVCPGTVITYNDLETGEPKTEGYRILHDRPIATMDFKEFMSAITPFLGSSTTQKITHEQMREGVPQGTRHAQGMKYASFLVKVQKFDFETALSEMKRWNKLCKPPMVEHDLERMVKNAISYPDKTVKQMEERSEIEKTIGEFRGRETYRTLLKTLGYTVKRDEIAKQLDLLHVISMYASPINELKEAPTSEGKTYPIIQVVRLFPPEDIMVLGGLSPTALAHDFGVPVNKEGEDLRPAIQEIWDKIEKLKDEAVEVERGEKGKINRAIEKLQHEMRKLMKGSRRLIDLENKVLVFVDNPNPMTWARLRPIMSHDKWETTYKFTDRSGKSGPLTQVTVVLRGWPVFVAFKAEETPDKGYSREIWTQILSRGTTVPVEMSSEKYGEAIELTGVKKGLPQPIVNQWLHREDFEKCKKIISAIRQRVLAIKEKVREQTGSCELPNIFWIPFYEVISKNFPKKKGTHMREADRFFGIIQNHAVANIFNRPTLEIDDVSYLICTIHDLEKAVNLYFSDEARKTIFSKIPTNQIKFFEKVVLPLKEEWPGDITTARMQKKYKEVFDEPISTITINHHYLQPLENMDFISRDVDPNDKRRKLTEPLRDKVFDKEAQIYGLFKDDHILTLEMLKEQFSKLKQLMTKDARYNIVKIKDYNDTVIDVDTLYDTYFAKKSLTVERFSRHYYSGQADKPKVEKGEEIKVIPEKTVISTVPSLKSRTSTYVELATLGKDTSKGPIPLGEKIKNPIDIDKAFPPLGPKETLILLRSKWTQGTSKETQEQEFLDLIHPVRPDLTRKEAGTLFTKLIEDGVITYDPEGWLVWVKGG